eukprot:s214_g35.t1
MFSKPPKRCLLQGRRWNARRKMWRRRMARSFLVKAAWPRVCRACARREGGETMPPTRRSYKAPRWRRSRNPSRRWRRNPPRRKGSPKLGFRDGKPSKITWKLVRRPWNASQCAVARSHVHWSRGMASPSEAPLSIFSKVPSR